MSAPDKVKFLKGWSSMNDYYTSRMTFWTKRVLERCLARKLSKKLYYNTLKLHLDSFFRVIRFKYVTSKSIGGSFYGRDSDRIFKFFDVIFKDKKETYHHISIRGLFKEERVDAIFYEKCW